MKKIIFGCMIALGMASCTSDEVILDHNDATKINFAVKTQGNTRASDIYCPNNMIEKFKVSANNGTTTYFDGDEVTVSSDGSNSIGSTTRYWPMSGSLNFYAHVNGGDNYKWSENSAPSFEDFVPSTTVGSQLDLLYAVAPDQSKTTGTVNLNFRHALSQIVFKARNKNPNLYVEVYGVSVCQVNSQGTFTFPTQSTNSNIAHGATSGNPVQGSWEYAKQEADNTKNLIDNYSVSFDSGIPVIYANDNATVSPVNLTDYAAANDAHHANGENQYGKAMLLLPQETKGCIIVAAKDRPLEGVYFALKCKIWNVATPNEAGTKADNDILLYPATDQAADIIIPVDINWQQGKKYVYTFVFGDGNGGWTPDPKDPEPVFVPITFNVSVDEFVPVIQPDLNMQTQQTGGSTN